MYEKLRMLVKPVEFVAMMVIFVLGMILGSISFGWGVTGIIVYVVLNLTGWGLKTSQEVIDETKDNIEDGKSKFEEIKDKYSK